MSHLSQKELDLFTNQILEDYDAKNPGTIFKEKIEIDVMKMLCLFNQM